jgi:hypothetical protein
MGDWKPLNISHFQVPHNRDIGGVATDVIPSPFDIPTAVRSECNPNTHLYGIFFRYLSDPDEPVQKQAVEPDVTLSVGKETGRVLGIQIKCPPSHASIEPVAAKAAETLDRLVTNHTRVWHWKAGSKLRPENLRVAREVVADLDKGLFFA